MKSYLPPKGKRCGAKSDKPHVHGTEPQVPSPASQRKTLHFGFGEDPLAPQQQPAKEIGESSKIRKVFDWLKDLGK